MRLTQVLYAEITLVGANVVTNTGFTILETTSYLQHLSTPTAVTEAAGTHSYVTVLSCYSIRLLQNRATCGCNPRHATPRHVAEAGRVTCMAGLRGGVT